MTIVITMAGLGSRFRRVGYEVPKYQIVVNGHTLFHWSMLSLRGFASKNYIFIVRKEDHATAFITHACKELGIDAPVVLEIDHLTSGQAETAALAAPYWRADEPLLIYNIDTYVEAGQMCDAQLRGDGFIPCFTGEGEHWSFVRLDEAGKAVEIREKKRISDHCTVGAYYFRTAELYMELYTEYYLRGNRTPEAGERYVAPLYNYLVQKKHGEVYISDIPAACVHVLGTPEEVEMFRTKEMTTTGRDTVKGRDNHDS